jgi:alpha-galactosidase
VVQQANGCLSVSNENAIRTITDVKIMKTSAPLFFFAVLCWTVAMPAMAQQRMQTTLLATPPMGWNAWNHFKEKITDKIVRAETDAMVSSGMKAAGYEYIVIDDTWSGQRDAQGFIHPNEKFPDMKALADYVHSKGLKIGIYSSPAAKTCAGYEGSLGHEEQDAETYAKWGFDYLKYDWCQPAGSQEEMEAAYTKMYDALAKTGRPIVFSLCEYGRHQVWRWGPLVGGNLWRTTSDIEDDYYVMSENGFTQNGLDKFSGPGHWNDPDMLEVGNGGMNEDEYRTHMSLWAILAAPLMAGNDMTQMTPYTVELLTNPEVIAVDQDPLATQGHRVAQEGPLEVWMKPMADGSKVVGLFNRQYTTDPMEVDFSDIGISGRAALRDLWLEKDLGIFQGKYKTYVPAHGVVLLRIKPM